jgi:hypothetical protein
LASAGLARWVRDKRRDVQPGSKRERKAFRRDPLAVLTSMPEQGAEGAAPGLLGGLAEPLLDDEWAAPRLPALPGPGCMRPPPPPCPPPPA